ncbi:hypothetical protein ACFQ1I_35100 [Kitasatospora arboriphila]
MITYVERQAGELAAAGRWPELLGLFRRLRDTSPARPARSGTSSRTRPRRSTPPGSSTGTAARTPPRRARPRRGTALGGPRHPALLAPARPAAGARAGAAAGRPHPRPARRGGRRAAPRPTRRACRSRWSPGSRPAGRRASGCATTCRRRSPAGAVRAARHPRGPRPPRPPGRGKPVAGFARARLSHTLAPWLTAVCVQGTAPDAAARLAPGRRVLAGHLPFAAAYPALVQAASGTPRLGTAHGRLAVWHLLAAMVGTARPVAAEVNALVARLRCLAWSEPRDELWYLHLALEDPATGLAWAVSGTAEA